MLRAVRENFVLIEVPFDRNIAMFLRQMERSQVPDLPDRIIAATALYLGLPLLSRNHRIKIAGINTIWLKLPHQAHCGQSSW